LSAAAVTVIIILVAVTSIGVFKRRARIKPSYPRHPEPIKLLPYPDLKFVVISDTHYYDRSLGDSGPAFEAYMLTDRKLIRESVELIDLAIEKILESDAEVVFVPGDLTCEGEKISHLGMARALSRLREDGRRVYVIPGNHDINMLHGAVSYKGIDTESVDSISPEEFAAIYRDCGYDKALYRDEQSLSYVAELKEKLWLMAIDTCRYRENTPLIDQVGSRITQSLLDWLSEMFLQAAEQEAAVIAMVHHGVVEHWSGQGKLHPDYLVQDYNNFNRFLALSGVQLVFTGHYHTQDIALADYGKEGSIYDIETGSLVTPPCPMRFCRLAGNQLQIESVNIIEEFRPGSSFTEEAKAFMLETLELEIINTLRTYLVSDRDAALLAKYIAQAFVAHSLGDENIALKPDFDAKKLNLWGRIVYARYKKMADNLWTNRPPDDLNVTLELAARQNG
jgi:predicted phosphodiesterase